jgi:hypothetical protein
MSENIVITNGINKPWELQGTNYDKPEEIVLANLAVGQLAFLGSAFGKYLSTQATVTAELADAVNRVRDRSAEVSSLFTNWTTTSPKLDLSMPDSGPYPDTPGIVDVNDGLLSNVDKLVIANNLIYENELANTLTSPFNSTDQPNIFPCTYTFGPTSDGKTITGFSFRTEYALSNEKKPDFQLYYKMIGATPDESRVFVRYDGNEYEAKNFKVMWAPSTQADIDFMNMQLSLVGPGQNSRVLTDATQIVPVPSEANASFPGGADNLQQPAITMEIKIAQADFLEFKLDGGGYFYYQNPAKKIPLFDQSTLPANAGGVVQLEDGSYRYVVPILSKSGADYKLIKATPRPCLQNPTNLQRSEILSQYSDKVVRITQRSTEQTTYVNALTQRYNYFYEAATNILKAFTNLWSSLVSNI